MSTQNLFEPLLDKARALGAEADIIVDRKQSLSLKARAGDLEEQAVSATCTVGMRVIKDRRVGIAYSEATDSEALEQMLEQALLNAQFSKPDPYQLIPANDQDLRTDDSLLCPDSTMTTEERIDLALYLETTLAKREFIRNVPYNGLREAVNERQVLSTQGLRALSRSRVNSLFAYALAADGDITAMAGHGQAARVGETLSADALIDAIHRDATALLKGKPVPSNHYDVIFDTEAQSDLLSAFASVLSGKKAQDGVNPWREQLGKSVAASGFNLVDEALNKEGFGYELFDAEGTACGRTSIIEGGVLQTLLHNSASARYFGLDSTGHAQRGPRSSLGVSAHQLAVTPGKATESDLQSGEYLVLTDLDGLHSGVNALSGDFSLGASGYLCRNGERIQPVRGITVAANFYQLLHRIAAIGNSQHWNWQRSTLLPAIRFSDVAISG